MKKKDNNTSSFELTFYWHFSYGIIAVRNVTIATAGWSVAQYGCLQDIARCDRSTHQSNIKAKGPIILKILFRILLCCCIGVTIRDQTCLLLT